MVTPIRRRLAALAAAFVAAVACAPELVVHPHQAWEVELARQVTMRSTAPEPCAPTHHVDPAEIDVHPPCPGCLTGCAGQGVFAPPAGLAAGARLAALAPPADRTPPDTDALRLARGRAPPLA